MALIAPFACERLHFRFIAGADRLEDRLIFEIEKVRHLPKRVRMGPAHKPVANQTDVNLFHVADGNSPLSIHSSISQAQTGKGKVERVEGRRSSEMTRRRTWKLL